MVIRPIKMQPALTTALGPDLASRYCGPVAFYMLLKAAGYLPKDLEVDRFVTELDRQALTTSEFNWSRPAMSRYFRQKYGAKIVSWQVHGQHDINKMQQSGYLGIQEEVEFFERNIKGRSLKDIVQSGYPVIITMKPGFNTPGESVHAVILVEWSDDTVTVVDPDARNTQDHFRPVEVEAFISPVAGGTVILPREDK